MKDSVAYTVYIDAAYVLNGMARRNRHYSRGTNGDIWSKIYQAASTRIINCVKVKSHVTNEAQRVAYNMTAEAYLHNELADEVCTQATKTTARAASHRQDDGKQYRYTAQAAARIAVIEANIWASKPEHIYYDGTDHTKVLETRNTAVKRRYTKPIS